MGWNVVPEDIEARFGRVTEEQQARYTVEAYERIESEWPWVGVASYWFLKRPADWEKDQSWYYFRLLEPDFQPLPVYEFLAAGAKAPSAPEPLPAWRMSWQQARPFLFFAGASLLFFTLLSMLASGSGVVHPDDESG
jgi:hypothetical protein